MENKEIRVVIERKNIRNLYIRIKGDEVHVSAPMKMPEEKVRAHVESRKDWILKRLNETKLIVDDTIMYRGRKYRYKVVNGRSDVYIEPFVYDENGDISCDPDLKGTVTVSCRNADRDNALKLFYRHGAAELLSDIGDLLPKYLPVIRELGYRGLVHYEVKMQKSLWGICYPKNEMIRLSGRLIHYDQKSLEAVLWHELLHFIVRDHSPRFHSLACAYMPDYETVIGGLK